MSWFESHNYSHKRIRINKNSNNLNSENALKSNNKNHIIHNQLETKANLKSEPNSFRA